MVAHTHANRESFGSMYFDIDTLPEGKVRMMIGPQNDYLYYNNGGVAGRVWVPLSGLPIVTGGSNPDFFSLMLGVLAAQDAASKQMK